jgi:hypothetical protein
MDIAHFEADLAAKPAAAEAWDTRESAGVRP